MDTEAEAFKPPYMSFQTFWNFVSELASKPLPPRIDRSLMGSKSGTDQANLTSTLVSLGLVDDAGVVQPGLVRLVQATDAERKAVMAALVREHYPQAMEVSEQNGTASALAEAFRNSFDLTAPETRRKAMTFFLHAARTSELPVSVHFPATRAGSGAPGTTRVKRAAASKRKSSPNTIEHELPADHPKHGESDEYTVELKSGGTVSVGVSVNLFELSRDDRDFVVDLVDRLKGYPASPSDDPPK